MMQTPNQPQPPVRDFYTLTMENIPDPTLRRYIFGIANPKRNNILNVLISAMNNMMLMSFFSLFAIWKECRCDIRRMEDGEGEEQRSAVHAKRVNDVMEKIYCNNILTQETISFVFTEILLEARKNPDTPFGPYIKGTVTGSKFSKIAEIIRVWKISYQRSEKNNDLLVSLYQELLESLSILKYMKLEDEDGHLICTITAPDGTGLEADLSLFVKRIEVEGSEDKYYLYKADHRRGRVYLEYMNFGGSTIYKDEEDESGQFVIDRETFLALTCNRFERGKQDDLSMSLQINDFKYIHRLALCISDVLGAGTKRDLLDRINEKDVYRDNFRNKDIEEINWDNTLVMLMLEDGPSEIIETVLRSDINAFENILKSVMVRFLSRNVEITGEDGAAKPITYKDLKNEYLRRERLELAYQEVMQSGISRNRKVRTWIKNARIFLMSQFIISKVAETEVKNEAFYAESITMKLQKINSAIEKNGSVASLSMINKTLERVFRTLILFYNGIVEYAKAREEKLSQYGLNERHREGVLKEIQEASEDAFFTYVKERLAQKHTVDGRPPIKKASLGILIEEFCELCRKMDSSRGKATTYNEDGMLLHSVIGRRKICDLSIFRKITEHSATESDFQGVTNPPLTLTAFFNKVLKHDDPTVNVDDPKIIYNYINYIKDLFEFLNLNDDFKNKNRLPVQNIFDPIFPYVVRYSERNENRDRCSVCQYIINTDGGFEDTKIKMLTEYDYVMNELYYCIPNAESSTKNWWVSPLLISCRRFDELLLERGNGDGDDGAGEE